MFKGHKSTLLRDWFGYQPSPISSSQENPDSCDYRKSPLGEAH